MLTLAIKERNAKENLDAMRKKGVMPAVFYGRKESSTPISVSSVEFSKIWKEAGESTVITLSGVGEDHEALIYDVDLDPVTSVPRHVDFYVVEKGKKLKVNVPLEFIGVSNAVKDLGATLIKVLYEVEVEALPKDLPHSIEADISSLAEMGSQVLAKDLKMPPGVELVTKPEEVVASVAEAMKEPEVEVPMDLSSIEVEKRGKVEEEGAEGAAVEAPAPEKKPEK